MMKASSTSSEKRRVTTELTAAQKGLGELQTRIANMNTMSAKAAQAAAEQRSSAERELTAEQQTVSKLEVRSNRMITMNDIVIASRSKS